MAVVAPPLVSPLTAGEPKDLKARIDALAAPLIESEAVAGLAVGVIENGRSEAFGYGRVGHSLSRL